MMLTARRNQLAVFEFLPVGESARKVLAVGDADQERVLLGGDF